jgi:hypothetical protein
MAIARNPKQLRSASAESKAEAFISGAESADGANRNKRSTMIYVDPDLLARIDRAAKRLGISRSAFIVSSAAEKLERMDA